MLRTSDVLMHLLGGTFGAYRVPNPLSVFRLHLRHPLSYAGFLPSRHQWLIATRKDKVLTLFSIHNVPFGYRAETLKHVENQQLDHERYHTLVHDPLVLPHNMCFICLVSRHE